MCKTISFKAEPMRTEYQIELNDILDVIVLESLNTSLDALGNTGIDTAIERLDGVDKVEYNGHFGNFFYFRVSKEFDTQSTHEAISQILKEAMSKVTINTDDTKEIVLAKDIELLGSVEETIESYIIERCRELQWIDEEDSNTFAISYVGACCHHEFKFRLSHDNKLEIYQKLRTH